MQQTDVSRSNSIHSSASSDKYHGLIEKSAMKKARNALNQLFSYSYSIASDFYGVNQFITWWRIWQVLAPCLCASFPLWERNEFAKMFVNILSIPAHFVPVEFRESASFYFLIVYSVFFLIVFIALLFLAIFYQLYAQLPSWIPNAIAFFFATFSYIAHPAAAQLLGEFIGRMIQNSDWLSVSNYVAIVLAAVAYFISLYIIKNMVNVSATFRPTSLMTVTHTTQTFIYGIPILTTILEAVASQLDKIPRIVLTFVCALTYSLIHLSTKLGGGFVNINHSIIMSTCATTCSIILAIIAFQDIFDSSIPSIEVLAFFLIWALMFIATKFVINGKRTKREVLLDDIMEDENNFELVKSSRDFQTLVATGFSIAHPICLNWSLCQMGVRKWPNDINAWYIYVKFVAIYPEDTYILMSIGHSIIQNRIGGTFAKQTLEQISTLMKMRENNLSVALKDKLGQLSKLVQSAKHKLRHVWDMAIQGNLTEMERAIDRTYQATQSTNAQFNHLIRQFPNNRFITRSYSRFLLEVCADTRGFEKYDADTKMLQRGVMANEDQAHSLGLHAYPALPATLTDRSVGNVPTGTSEDNLSGSTLDNDSMLNEQMTGIAQNIDDLRFPALSSMLLIRWLFIPICFILPIVICVFYGNSLVSRIEKPLDFVYELSQMRSYCNMLSLYSIRFAMEKDGAQMDAPTMEGIGGFTKTEDQLFYIINETLDAVQGFVDFQSYETNNEYLEKARKVLYKDLVPYNKTTVYGTIEAKEIITSSIISDYIQLATNVMEAGDSATVSMADIKTLTNNKETLTTQIETAMEHIEDYISNYQKHVTKIQMLVCIIVSAIMAIAWIILIAVACVKVNQEKEEVYRCLTSLQKNIVSAISDKLKLIKKVDQQSSTQGSESDLNKQEENIIKIFATADDGTAANSTFTFSNGITAALQTAFFIASAITLFFMLKTSNNSVSEASPHINDLMGTFTYQLITVDSLFNLFINSATADLDTEVGKMESSIYKAFYFFNLIRYGNATEGTNPFSEFVDSIKEKASQEEISPEVTFIESLVKSSTLIKYCKHGHVDTITKEDLQAIWDDLNNKLYVDFFSPVFTNIIPDVNDSIDRSMLPSIAAICTLIVCMIIVEIIQTVFNHSTEEKLRFTLKLLQHCPPHVIQQSQRIMAVLSGNFGGQKSDKTTRDSDYYLEIIQNMPDSIIVVNHNIITAMNKSAERLFEKKAGPTDTMQSLCSQGNAAFIQVINTLTEQAGTVEATYNASESNIYNIEVSLTVIKDDYVYTIRDNTQNKRYNTLIAEERMKSDMLLASILPPKLVGRVQSGEKDISFEIQSASIIFMDIVEFTPWCASLKADEVMATLNYLFTTFDQNTSKFQTLTRIKCIGDCYMAAGGIFAEVNQPELHARESVQFGLDSIQSVRSYNQTSGQSLRIRVGINTGGPLVGGVIGVGKPTFEIIGPAINMAQQMEHCGVPMEVHISRSVYELIYGGSFHIKERGQIEIKNGTAVTYLVSQE